MRVGITPRFGDFAHTTFQTPGIPILTAKVSMPEFVCQGGERFFKKPDKFTLMTQKVTQRPAAAGPCVENPYTAAVS